MKCHFLRELTNGGLIDLIFYKNEDQVVDIFMKPLKFVAFLRRLLGIYEKIDLMEDYSS